MTLLGGNDTDPVDAERAEYGLRRYVGLVARGLGVGTEGMWCELADVAAVYLALDVRLAAWPGRDVALVWDERGGWAVGVEPRVGDHLVMVAWCGPELLPAAEVVVRFVRAVVAGHVDHPTRPSIPAAQSLGLRARLAQGWAGSLRGGS